MTKHRTDSSRRRPSVRRQDEDRRNAPVIRVVPHDFHAPAKRLIVVAVIGDEAMRLKALVKLLAQIAIEAFACHHIPDVLFHAHVVRHSAVTYDQAARDQTAQIPAANQIEARFNQ